MRQAFISSLAVKVGAGALVILGVAAGCGDDDDDDSNTADPGGSSGSGGSGGSSAGKGGTSADAGASSGGDTGTGGDTGSAGAAGAPGLLDPRLVVDLEFASLLPSEQEFVAVISRDDHGLEDTLTVTSSDQDVATGSVIGGTLVLQAGSTIGEATITVSSGSGLERTVTVLVSDPRALKIGDDLLIAFVDDFDVVYSDIGSGASDDGSYWKPRVGNGFYPVGHLGRSGWDDPSGTRAMVVVKALSEDALAAPLDYTSIWSDGDPPGSFWRPVCPVDYEALGSIAEGSQNEPSLDAMRCVRSDLAEIGAIGGYIWDDSNSGAATDVSTWSVEIPAGTNSIGTMPLNAGTFVGVSNYNAPSSDETANILRLPIPIVREVDIENAFPTLDSLSPPEETTPVHLGRTVLIPFTGVNDPARTFDYKVKKSPFYRLDRDVYYRRLLHQYNQTSTEQNISHDVTAGVSSSQTESFSITTGISVSVSSGVSFGVNASTTVTMSLELGYESSTTVGEFMQESLTKDVTVPPKSSAALWQLIHRFTLKRRNGNLWETIGTPWEVGVNSFVVDAYPD